MSTKVADVIVVGAGISGLTAAYRLTQAEASVLVLEASSRVGGRLFSIEAYPGKWIDLGGQWVGPTQVDVLGLLKELELETFPQPVGAELLEYRGDLRGPYKGTIPPLPLFALLEVQFSLLKTLNREAAKIDAVNPERSPNALEYDSITLDEWARRNMWTDAARKGLELAIRATLCAETTEVSFLAFLWYIRTAGSVEALLDFEGGAQQDRIIGGTDGICRALWQRIGPEKVKFNSPVTEIKQDADCVSVRDLSGNVYHGSRVILALPPTSYRRINFIPGLPVSMQTLVNRLFMGSMCKIWAVYPRAFWVDRGLSGMAVTMPYTPRDRQHLKVQMAEKEEDEWNPITTVCDGSNHDRSLNALVVFVNGFQTVLFLKKPEELRKKLILDRLSQYFGEEARSPDSYVEQNWMEDPWAMGAYTTILPVGAMTLYSSLDDLRRPIGRIHMAGTETATKWPGYMSGGVQAGDRAAVEVLKVLKNERQGSG